MTRGDSTLLEGLARQFSQGPHLASYLGDHSHDDWIHFHLQSWQEQEKRWQSLPFTLVLPEAVGEGCLVFTSWVQEATGGACCWPLHESHRGVPMLMTMKLGLAVAYR